MKPHLKTYSQIVDHIRTGIYATATEAKQQMALRQFYTVTANFVNFYPELLNEYTYEEAFLEVMWRRRLAVLDEATTERVDDICFTGNFTPIINREGPPNIYCAYHLGSYRAIIGAMARFGHDFALVVNKGVFENQNESINETVHKINEHTGLQSKVEILDAEKYDTAMKMLQILRSGKSIIAYVDGNTGTGGAFRKDTKMLKLNFLGQPIFARQGISYISFLSNASIVPVISYRNAKTDLILEFYDPISPMDFTSRKAYCAQTTRALYKILEEKVKAYPLQYEAWLYLQKFLDTEDEERIKPKPNELPESGIHFNHHRFGLFKMGKKNYLFDRYHYRTFELGDMEYRLTKQLWDATGNLTNELENLGEQIVNKLRTHLVLIGEDTKALEAI